MIAIKSSKPDAQPIELDSINIIVQIPKETAFLTLLSHVIDDEGEPLQCSCVYTPSQLAKARRDFLENVAFGDDYGAVYELTDKGREYLNELEAKHDKNNKIEGTASIS